MAPPSPSLPGHEVHVWRASLEASSQRVQELSSLLAADERGRAERFHFERDRAHFIVARGLLRTLLGGYLGLEPEALLFGYGSYGKPHLQAGHTSKELNFNVSHSHGMALLAFAWNRQLGVDIERIRPTVAGEGIAERFFSPHDVACLNALPAGLQAEGFFNCWTRKEAYIKARGEGLSLPLDQFDVSLVPGEPAALLATRIHPREVTRWSLADLEVGAGFKAALAVEGQGWTLRRLAPPVLAS